MRHSIRYVLMIIYYRFIITETCEEAVKKGYSFYRNVFGDEINHKNCRSFWTDEYGFLHRVAELKQ